MSVWFSLVASTLRATGWPADAEPEPIDELFVDQEILLRWAIPSQLMSLALTGRPAFRRLRVHGALHVVERVLEERPAGDLDDPNDGHGHDDEERFEVRWVHRPMRLGLGNAVEPAALIRRYGADALRLGYLLSLHSGSLDLATAAESNLRRARRAVRRLSAKVTGLFHLAAHPSSGGHHETGEGPPALADDWILARAATAADAARSDLGAYRLGAAGRCLAETIDDFARYAAIAAGRRRADRPARHALASIPSTVTGVIAQLASGFSPICPYIFEKLTAWTTPRAAARTDVAPIWVDQLVTELKRDARGAVVISSSDDVVLARLRHDRKELEQLAGCGITVSDTPAVDGVAFGPCVVRPGALRRPAGA